MNCKHIHLHALGGIAGDMFVAAMLDAFPGLQAQVMADIRAVLPHHAGEVRLEQVLRHGISALHFSLDESVPASAGPADRPSASQRAVFRAVTAPPSPARAAVPVHGGTAGQTVSDYAGVRRLIEQAELGPDTAAHALGILDILAQAESRIHGVPIAQVHFHELAAWDSLMDVVAAGSVIAWLGEAVWSMSPLPLGSGRVRTQHGPLPVPAPATLRILEGYPWISDDVPGERVTPTGAAIVRHLISAGQATRQPAGVLHAQGYGAGTRDFAELANVLRVMVFDMPQAGGTPGDAAPRVKLVQFDIDDMNGEEIGIATDHLRAVPGVLDVLLIPAQGKKGRPVTVFQMLVEPACFEEVCSYIFQETSTIGLRYSDMLRRTLPREAVLTRDGLRMKQVWRPGGEVTTKLESDELESTAWLAHRRQIKSAAEGERHD